MPRRLPGHPAQSEPVAELLVDGEPVRGRATDSLAAAAFAAGARVLSRSLKYHRPRAMFCLEGHCGGCLVRVDGVPSVRACQQGCDPSVRTSVESQNAYPSAELDVLAAVDLAFPRGMDHHTLMTGSRVLNHLAGKVVRQLSGLGKLPARAATELPEVERASVDAVVIGAGPAGLAAAHAIARGGWRVLVVDDQLAPGGSLRADPRHGRRDADARVAAAVAAGARLVPRSTAIAFFPEDEVAPTGAGDGARGVLAVATPDHLLRVDARAYVWATGGYATNLPFPDNDRPGVLAARAVGRLLVEHGLVAGERVCVVEPATGTAPAALAEATDALAAALAAAGVEVTRAAGADVVRVHGRGWVTGVTLRGERRDFDAVAVAAIPSPASEGPRQHGCEVVLDPAAGGFRVVVDPTGRTRAPGVWACGDVCGFRGPAAAAAHGAEVGAAVAASLG